MSELSQTEKTIIAMLKAQADTMGPQGRRALKAAANRIIAGDHLRARPAPAKEL